MLVDPQLNKEHNALLDVLSRVEVAGNQPRIVRLGQGLYRCNHFNFEHEVEGKWELWSEIGEYNSYGVCDSPEQFMSLVGPALEASKDEYVVCFHELCKSNQSEDGGWRWHKWGPYIGTQDPQCEYLYDEPVIERVCTYHFYKRIKET